MSHNTLPPSKYGTGTTYEGDGTIKHIIPAAEHESETYKIPVTMPRIVRVSGAIAVENSTLRDEALIEPSFQGDTSRLVVQQREQPRPDSYKSPNERQQALEIAEIANILRAAEKVGMTVDQWKANRHKNRH